MSTNRMNVLKYDFSTIAITRHRESDSDSQMVKMDSWFQRNQLKTN